MSVQWSVFPVYVGYLPQSLSGCRERTLQGSHMLLEDHLLTYWDRVREVGLSLHVMYGNIPEYELFLCDGRVAVLAAQIPKLLQWIINWW